MTERRVPGIDALPCPLCDSIVDGRKLPTAGRERLILASRLHWLRLGRKLSIRDVQKATHIGFSRLKNIEYGMSLPLIFDLIRLARFYEVSLDELCDGLAGAQLADDRIETSDATPH